MKKILILGGTNFIGRYLTERLLESSGYEITLFNRGYTNAHLFPEVNRIFGDRYIFISTCSVYLPDKKNKDLLTEYDKVLNCSEKEKRN